MPRASNVASIRGVNSAEPERVRLGYVADAYMETTRTAWAENRVVERELTFAIDSDRKVYFVVAFPLGAKPDEPYGIGTFQGSCRW